MKFCRNGKGYCYLKTVSREKSPEMSSMFGKFRDI